MNVFNQLNIPKIFTVIVCSLFLFSSTCIIAKIENNSPKDISSASGRQKIDVKERGEEKLEGIDVVFDYQGYPKEREFFYQHYLKDAVKEHPLKKEEIGIFLYDLDNDGKEEALVYLHNLGLCGVKGCLFEIFKSHYNPEGSQKQEYKNLPTGWGVLPETVRILDNSTFGYRDIEIAGSIWKWGGSKYEEFKN